MKAHGYGTLSKAFKDLPEGSIWVAIVLSFMLWGTARIISNERDCSEWVRAAHPGARATNGVRGLGCVAVLPDGSIRERPR